MNKDKKMMEVSHFGTCIIEVQEVLVPHLVCLLFHPLGKTIDLVFRHAEEATPFMEVAHVKIMVSIKPASSINVG
jgi:hypothetical protein